MDSTSSWYTIKKLVAFGCKITKIPPNRQNFSLCIRPHQTFPSVRERKTAGNDSRFGDYY